MRTVSVKGRFRPVCLLAVAAAVLCAAPVKGFAGGEIDILLDKLVEKGVLTKLEAQIIRDETRQQMEKDLKSAEAVRTPGWVRRIKLKGDFRLRYQYERRRHDDEARMRGRVRYRLGLIGHLNDQWEWGAGLASGGSDPRSTNQTFENTFETPDIRLDHAYILFRETDAVMDEITVVGGRFVRKPFLWTPTDMIWDGDINPTGASLHVAQAWRAGLKGFLNTGVWVMDEKSRSSDRPAPFLTYLQAGVQAERNKAKAKGAVTYYATNGVKGACLDHANGTNTRSDGTPGACASSNPLKYDYDALGASAQVSFEEALGGLPFGIDEKIAVFGDFIRAFDPGDENSGFAAGIRIGRTTLKQLGDWRLTYIFVRLGRDAWLDTFPDSDRLGGDTNVRSHEAILQLGVRDNIWLGFDYYQSVALTGIRQIEHLIQGDFNLKF